MAYMTEWFKVSRGGCVFIYGKHWYAWPWSKWAKVKRWVYTGSGHQ